MAKDSCLRKRIIYIILLTASLITFLGVQRYFLQGVENAPIVEGIVETGPLYSLKVDMPTTVSKAPQNQEKSRTIYMEGNTSITLQIQKEETETAMDSIAGTGLLMSEILSKQKARVKAAVGTECAPVLRNTSTFWRSVTSQPHTMNEDFKNMNLAAGCAAFFSHDLMNYNPREKPFPWELDYLSQPALTNMADTSWASLSEVVFLNETGKATLQVGDKVRFRITVKNGRKERRKLGGDSLRLWLVNKEKDKAIGADVTDHNNGTYTAETIVAWAGDVLVRATIAHTRELFRTVIYIQRMFKSMHWFTGNFINDIASEATPCSTFPALPGFSSKEMCNLTKLNGGFPWYCGKPLKTKYNLNCDDLKSVRKINSPSMQALTDAEQKLVDLTEAARPFFIPNTIKLTVTPKLGSNETTLPTPKLPCAQRDLTETFNDTNISGYLYKKEWRPLACYLPSVDKGFLTKCLTNTEFIIIGDSNSRLQTDILQSQTDCKHKLPRTGVIWHAPLQCDIDAVNASIKYYPPKHPFYGSVGENIKNSVLYSVITQLDAIPSTGRYLVHLHDFLHVVPFHPAVVEHRLRLVRDAIARLLVRNVHVIVIYQSAHTAYDRLPLNKFKLNQFVHSLQRDILRGLGNRVMFANVWPITMVTENTDSHPTISPLFPSLYMGYVCERAVRNISHET